MSDLVTKTSTSTDSFCPDCSPFLNWDEEEPVTEREMAVVFQSLVATVKFQPTLDDSLEAKAVNFLESLDLDYQESADAFLNSFGQTNDDSLINFIQSIAVLISSASPVITASVMKILRTLIKTSSTKTQLSLLKADLIPQLVRNLNPQSFSFVDAVDIHNCLISIVTNSVWLATPDYLRLLGIGDGDEQQAVHNTFFQQVLASLEKYIWHLCLNRYSIVDGVLSSDFMELLAHLLRICPYYQPTMDFVLHMPVVLTIPSCLTFTEKEEPIRSFLWGMINDKRKWNKQGGEVRFMWKIVLQMLRMEGIEDVIEEKLHNDKDENFGVRGASNSIEWNTLQGMNILEQQ